jgi:hypothetical protein
VGLAAKNNNTGIFWLGCETLPTPVEDERQHISTVPLVVSFLLIDLSIDRKKEERRRRRRKKSVYIQHIYSRQQGREKYKEKTYLRSRSFFSYILLLLFHTETYPSA